MNRIIHKQGDASEYQSNLLEATPGQVYSDHNVRLFRSPKVHDTNDDCRSVPHEITWDEIEAGDMILAMLIGESAPGSPARLHHLDLWQVMSIEGDELDVVVSQLLGPNAAGDMNFDCLAGQVGLPL